MQSIWWQNSSPSRPCFISLKVQCTVIFSTPLFSSLRLSQQDKPHSLPWDVTLGARLCNTLYFHAPLTLELSLYDTWTNFANITGRHSGQASSALYRLKLLQNMQACSLEAKGTTQKTSSLDIHGNKTHMFWSFSWNANSPLCMLL